MRIKAQKARAINEGVNANDCQLAYKKGGINMNKLSKRIIAITLILIMICASFMIIPTRVEAASKVTFIRGPRISKIDSSKKNGITIIVKDDTSVATVDLYKYYTEDKAVKMDFNDTAKESKITEYQSFIKADDIAKVGEIAKFKLVATDTNGAKRSVEFKVKRLEKVKNGKYFSVNLAPRLEYCKMGKTLHLKIKDLNGIREIKVYDMIKKEEIMKQVGDDDNNNLILDSNNKKVTSYDADTYQETFGVDKTGRAKIKVVITDGTGLKSEEEIYIKNIK